MITRRRFLGTSMGLGLAALAPPAAGQGAAGSVAGAARDPDRWRSNEKIQESRRMALHFLQPSARDLEHGLSLHADSLVCEGYGFSPRSAANAEVVNAAINGGASAREVQELIELTTATGYLFSARELQEYLDAWEASGVTCIIQNAGEETQSPLRMLRRLSVYTHVTDRLRDYVMRGTCADDVEAARKSGRRCLIMMTNGVPLQQDWNSVEEELFNIGLFYRLGVRLMHLTYNRRNMIGDGCSETANGGLSDFGRHVVREMNRVGVIVDLAHSGWRTSLEAARQSSKPVVISHSACAALNPDVRCQPDEVIRAVADSGGYIGITCIPRFLGGTGDIRAMMDHIEYAVKTFGADHVAIATDFAYTSRTASDGSNRVSGRPRSRAAWNKLWPPTDWVNRPEMMRSMDWTNWPLFTVGMVQRGFKDEEIRKILGGNTMRVLRAVVPDPAG